MKKFRYIIVLLVVLAIGIAGFTSYHHIRHRAETEKTVQTMPTLSFQRQDGGLFDNSAIDPSAERVLFDYFNPECEHCQYMAQELVAHAGLFAHYQIVLVTTADSLAVARFRADYGLGRVANLTITRDPKFDFLRLFGPSMIPAFYIYGRDGRLIRKIMGETKLENILK